MSHGMLERDVHQATSMGWHGLTKVYTLAQGELALSIPRAECWLNGWDAIAVKVDITGNMPQGMNTPSVPWYTFIASDDGLPIGEPFNPASYTPITNKQMLDALYAFVDGRNTRLISCGSFGNRSKIYSVLELPEKLHEIRVGDKIIKPYLNAFWSHDKTLEVYFVNSGIVTVCQNTFQMNMALGKEAIKARVKHTKNAQVKVDNLDEIIAESIDVASAMAKIMVQLRNARIDLDTARQLFAGFVVRGNKQASLSTRAANVVDRLVELFVRGAGNKGESLLDAMQAVTDFYTHESAGGENKWKQFVSSEFGAASNVKAAFARLVVDDTKRLALIEAGQKAIVERQKENKK